MKDLLQDEPDEHDQPPFDQPRPREGSWFWLEEAPFEPADDLENTQEALSLEFRRVKSLREEQESKVALFLREDKCKSRGGQLKQESPLGKQSLSLSPRKTKKIDKGRPLKLFQESC
jgi:hypothetical protein